MGGYVRDLKHYTESNGKTEVTEALQNKFKNSLDIWKQKGKISLIHSLRAFFTNFRKSGRSLNDLIP